MKKLLVCILTILFYTLQLPAGEEARHSITCSKALQPALSTLRKLPEIETLIQQVLQEGPLKITYNGRLSSQFEGYWDPYNRTILVTKGSNRTEAARINTMLFEMHNASRTKDFKALDRLASRGKIGQEEYVRRSEYIEYENCLSTARLLDKGIRKGIFPAESAWSIHDNFRDHYRLMKRSGHAAWHASAYKRMQCYTCQHG